MTENDSGNSATYDAIIRRAIEHLNHRSIGELSEMCRQAAAVDESRCEAYFLLAIAAYLVDDLGRAVDLATKGHEISPDCNEINDLLAHLQAHIGKPESSVYYAKLVSVGESNPLLASVQVDGLDNLAKALNETQEISYRAQAMRAMYQEHYQDAIRLFEKELRLRNGDGEFFRHFGLSLCKTGELYRGISAFHAAIHMEPDNAEGYLRLGDGYLMLGNYDMARACHERALHLAGNDIDIIAGISFSHSPMSSKWPAFDKAVKAWGKSHSDKATSAASTKEKKDRDTIRVGYLMDRSTQCDELRFIESVLWNYDRNHIEYYIYSRDCPEDMTPEQLKGLVTFWADTRDLNDEILTNTILHHDLDILIDMTLTSDGQRFDVLAAKPAPKIYKWPGVMQEAFSFLYDGVLRGIPSKGASPSLAPIMIKNENMPEVDGKSPVHTRGNITFGSTADLTRVTPDVVMIWSDILRQIPDSKIVLGNIQNITPAVENHIMDMFASAGISDRIVMEEMEVNPEDGLVVSRLRFLVGMDIYLDPFPRTGFMELTDALWSGVPVITMSSGKTGSASASILTAVGYPEWIAKDVKSYIKLAVSMSETMSKDMDWRVAMHGKVKASMLFQAEAWKEKHSELLQEVAGSA